MSQYSHSTLSRQEQERVIEASATPDAASPEPDRYDAGLQTLDALDRAHNRAVRQLTRPIPHNTVQD